MPYYWDEFCGKSTWALAPELWPGTTGRQSRILCLTMDEGSQGFSLFQFLASHCKMRVIFVRDPSHRLSNLFVNGLRTIPTVMKSVWMVHILHKFRRAPHGGGKFWRSLKECLKALSGGNRARDLYLD